MKVKKNPDDASQFFIISDRMAELGAFSQMEGVLKTSPEALRLIRDRVQLKPIDLEVFKRKPEGTLARCFADFIIRNKLDPNFYPALKARNDGNYVVLRMRQLHDIMHVVTGFETTEQGELGVQGFLLSQLASPLSMILVGAAILFLPFHKSEKWELYLSHITRGWILGKAMKPCFNEDWDALWDLSLDEVRRRLDYPFAVPTQPVRTQSRGSETYAH